MIKGIARLLFVSVCACSSPSTDTETSSRAIQIAAPNAQPAEPALPHIATEQPGVPRVAFLGDSIAAGKFLAEHQAFPSVLQRRMRAQGTQFELINAGVIGDTTESGLRRIDWILKQSPDIVVVELGENDKSEGTPVTTVEANLRAIVAKIKAADAQPLLLGVRGGPPDHMSDRESAQSYAREFDALYPRLASELDLAFVPRFMQGVEGRRELTLPDGTHPTPEGHERIALTIYEPLRALLTK